MDLDLPDGIYHFLQSNSPLQQQIISSNSTQQHSVRTAKHPRSPPRHTFPATFYLAKMGRGGYDTTKASSSKSAAAAFTLNANSLAQAEAERKEEVRAALAEEQRLIRSKKSRGIRAAKRAGREAANAAKMDEKTPSGENEGEKKT
ncbi:hypothetical protein IQ06DRAFT_345250 [Phaeosphaeriaceae sp. SRC1lsM3a]|nr:hypothetical protein IQ06DRAFT_345250 [Stagonospora sp. SRC1lsM3a]